MLVGEGFEVNLAGSQRVRNVTGRKNEEDDAVWIQKLEIIISPSVSLSSNLH
jgi:hypothetical protein